MTEQPKEYIITTPKINTILNAVQGAAYREIHEVLRGLTPVNIPPEGTAPERRKRNKGSPEGWCSESCGFFGACDAADVRACKKDAHRNAHDAAIRKDERERALKLAADIWGIAACVEKKNTDEFMEYFRKCMKEFEERYNSLKSPEQEQKP